MSYAVLPYNKQNYNCKEVFLKGELYEKHCKEKKFLI